MFENIKKFSIKIQFNYNDTWYQSIGQLQVYLTQIWNAIRS